GARGMLYFNYFIPPYQNWTGSGPDLSKDIEGVYDNLRGINLAKFRADATQLSASNGKLADITMNLSTATNSLGGFWQGSAAQAAQQYCGTFMGHGKTVTDGTNAASQLITDQMKAIETAVLQRSQAVLKMYASDIGGFTSTDIQMIIDAAKLSAGDDELRQMGQWNVFSNVDWSDTNCNGSLSQNVKNLAAMDAANWLNSTFKPNFDEKKSAFDSITKSTHDTVGQAFDAMNQGIAKINANPFSDLSGGIQVPKGSGSGSGSGHGSGSGAGSGGSGSGGGPTMPSGAGSGSGGGPTMPSGAGSSGAPSVPPPPSPPPPPSMPTPPTVPPVTVPSAANTGTPETLTVQHGANTLTMTGPNSHGTMQLTTKDGSGQPKAYDIAFATPPTPTPTPTASTAAAPASPAGVQHITPGPDGKAVIHDGNTTITATEQPGGEVKVTVDDGTGQPTTYTLGPAQPTAGGQQPIPTQSSGPTAVTASQPGFTPPPGAGFTPPATAGVTPPSPVGFTDPTAAAASQPGFTDPSVAAAHTPAADPSTLMAPTAATPQTTHLASVMSPGNVIVGGTVDPTGGSAFAGAFHDPSSAFSDALGGAAGGSHAAADHLVGPSHHDMSGHAGVAGTDVTPIGQPGQAGLASAPGSAMDQAGQPGQLGGGGQGGGDGQRGPSQWRTQGQLFDDAGVDDVVGRFSGTLDDGR
ncbi:MAG TPA: hypothetical protein VGD84_15435, partial [Pseudonocardiaceae bacterium]